MADELWRRSASELAEMIRSGEATSRQVVEAHLERIDAVNGELNAITVVLADTALAAADAADRADGATGPLHGVPFTVKENIDCVGSATTQGLPLLADANPPVDAPSVARMKAAGGIPLARTNLPEMGLRITTDNPLRGRTLNPWTRELTAGGSSGGEAAALATGMSPIGLGNDLGGSLRNPAYCCGISSLKPTLGRVPAASAIPPEDPPLAIQAMAVEGPMARSVADLRLAIGLLSGFDPRDPASVPAPASPGAPSRRRAAIVTSVPGVELPSGHVDAIREAGEALAAAGWEVVDEQPPELELVTDLWGSILSFDIAAMLPMVGPMMSAEAVEGLERVIERYPLDQMPPQAVWIERHRMARAWSSFLADHPVIVGPTWCLPPFEHDADLDPDRGGDVVIDRLRFITPGNLLGLPSAAVPIGVADGLPTGVQVYAERWHDELCLDAAEVIEAATADLTPIDPVWS